MHCSAHLGQGAFLADGNPNTISHLTAEKLKRYRFPCPPLAEQSKIAEFLDVETAKVDALIQKKRALIEKLQEKRRALLSRVVTRGLPPEAAHAAGLNPEPRFKPSGIDWLGQIPSHWELKALRYLCRMRSGESIASDLISEEGEYAVYGGNGIRGCTDKYTHQGLHVLVGRQGALCGNVNYAGGRFWATEHAVVVTCGREVDAWWLGELLRSMNLNQYSMSAAQPGLAVEQVQSLRVPVPPYPEQCVISHHLRSETAQLNSMVEKIEQAIARLREYRSALIAAGVTGKVDVREGISASRPELLVAAG